MLLGISLSKNPMNGLCWGHPKGQSMQLGTELDEGQNLIQQSFFHHLLAGHLVLNAYVSLKEGRVGKRVIIDKLE